ncbi:hypothetical protein [Nocardia sp. NPDC050412]|uniref:hypothetical protein n=1 Tax=Nocardia sp. NPDC050412 TaxID=3364320 RepID=UPI0037918277
MATNLRSTLMAGVTLWGLIFNNTRADKRNVANQEDTQNNNVELAHDAAEQRELAK